MINLCGSDLGGHVEGEELGYDEQDGEDAEDQDPLPNRLFCSPIQLATADPLTHPICSCIELAADSSYLLCVLYIVS